MGDPRPLAVITRKLSVLVEAVAGNRNKKGKKKTIIVCFIVLTCNAKTLFTFDKFVKSRHSRKYGNPGEF